MHGYTPCFYYFYLPSLVGLGEAGSEEVKLEGCSKGGGGDVVVERDAFASPRPFALVTWVSLLGHRQVLGALETEMRRPPGMRTGAIFLFSYGDRSGGVLVLYKKGLAGEMHSRRRCPILHELSMVVLRCLPGFCDLGMDAVFFADPAAERAVRPRRRGREWREDWRDGNLVSLRSGVEGGCVLLCDLAGPARIVSCRRWEWDAYTGVIAGRESL